MISISAGLFDDTESELFSDTSSISSGSSIRSGTSSRGSLSSGKSRKTQRKRQRKRWNTKPGSRFEEVALIQALAKNIEATQTAVGESVSYNLFVLLLGTPLTWEMLRWCPWQLPYIDFVSRRFAATATGGFSDVCLIRSGRAVEPDRPLAW